MILRVNNKEVDIGTAKIAFSKKFYSLSNLNDRKLDYSNNITLPSTDKNLQIFNRPQRVDFEGDKFNKFYPFTYSFSSWVLFKGSVILESANNSLSVQLVDSSKEYFESLTEKLNKLDFESDDFVFSLTEYDNKKVLNESVWIWAAVAMHEKRIQSKSILAGGAATDKLKYSRPLISVRKLREKIQKKLGWSTNFSELLSEQGQLAISANHKTFYLTSYQKKINNSVIINDLTYLQGLEAFLDYSKTGTDAILFPDTETIRVSTNGYNATAFRLRGYIESTSDIEIEFQGVSKNSTETQNETFIIKEGLHFYDLTTKEYNTDELYYDIKIALKGDANVSFSDTLLYTIIKEENLGDFKDNKLIDYYVKVYDNMPDFTQLELLKTVWVLSGAFHVTDNFRKEINLYALKTLSKNSAIDASAKLDTSNYKIHSNLGNLAKTNFFEYDNDDTITESTGRGQFTINSDVLPDFGTWYKSIFSASNDVVIENIEMADFNIYSDTERINTINPRILFVNPESEEVPYASATFKVLRGDNVLNLNYKNIISSFQNLQIVECNLNFSRLDFFSFNGLRTIYLDYFKSTFLVLEINEYIDGRTTNVKLLKFK